MKKRSRRTTKSSPRRRSNPRKTRKTRSTRKSSTRRNPTMPVVLVNPTKRRSTTRRRNPAKKKRRRRPGKHLVAGYRVPPYRRRYPLRENPAKTVGAAAIDTGLGFVGGLVPAGFDWGCEYLPWPAWAQALSLFGAGTITAIAGSRLADRRIGAGVAGGTSALLVGRVRQLVAMSGFGADEEESEASAVYRNRESGVVVRAREAGAMRQITGAHTMQGGRLPGRAPSFVEAGARKYGPRSWVYGDAGAVYVSAHNR